MDMGKPQNKPKERVWSKEAPDRQAPAKPKLVSKLIPFIIFGAAIAGVLVLDYADYIDIQDILTYTYEIKDHAIMNKPYAFDFASKLIPMLNPEWDGSNRDGYTFYLGPNSGFPPMGLILGTNGLLIGTPTGWGTTFVVCVKDVGGNEKCIKVHLTVDEEEEPSYVTPVGTCPATSHDTDTPCGGGVSGIYVPLSCLCPSDTYDYGSNFVIDDVEYRTCICR